jgi:hypothetical protein
MIEKIREYTPINFELAGNPINWVIVLLMVFIAGLAVSLIFHPADQTGS